MLAPLPERLELIEQGCGVGDEPRLGGDRHDVEGLRRLALGRADRPEQRLDVEHADDVVLLRPVER